MTAITASASGATVPSALYSIDFVRHAPASAPAIADFKNGGRTFSALQLGIVGKVLDRKIFYQDAFREACRAEWEAAFPVVDACITNANGDLWVEMVENSYLTQQEELKKTLKMAPRGTYALLRKSWTRGAETFACWYPLVADGFGDVYAPMSHHHSYAPSHATMCAEMVDMEIYLARKAEETRRELCASAALIRARGWRAGTTLKGVTVGRDVFSSAKITAISGEGPDGAFRVELLLVKSGSRKRYTWSGMAQVLQVEGVAPAQAPIGTPVVTKLDRTADDLFSNAA